MKSLKTSLITLTIFITYGFSQNYIGQAAAPQEEMSIWFRRPAVAWEGEVLPLGNGFIGASIYGGVDREHIQFNEHSLWTGGPGEVSGYTGGNRSVSLVSDIEQVQQLLAEKNYSAADDEMGDLLGNPAGFGAYQNFGDLYISFFDGIVIEASSENGTEAKENAFDGNTDTKWFTGSDNGPPFWIQCTYPKPQVITGYSLTSANDVPERDPLNWTLRGSNDGVNWVTLHTVNGEDFPQRYQTKSYSFTNSESYTIYRFDFENNSGNTFQLAEIEFDFASGEPDLFEVHDYRRDLNLKTAVATVNYTYDDIDYTREYFCTLPDSVFAAKIYPDQSGALNCSVSLDCAHAASVSFENGVMTHRGSLSNNMIFESQTAVILSGGSLSWNGNDGIEVSGADTMVVLFAAGTDYENVYPDYKGDDPHNSLTDIIDNARTTGFESLLGNHVSDYESLFNRMSLDIGQTKSSVPTDQLLSNYTGDSRMLEAVYFQFGRYMLISSSREGSLPANLQGIWNNTNSPPWSADYHTNINVQMNYWPAEMTNLSECHLPLIDYTDNLRPRGRETAEIHYGCGGWVTHHMNNIFGHTGPNTDKGPCFFPESAGWLCRHLWEHYSFTQDIDYLRNRAWPVMKEASQFWLEFLVVDSDDGTLVVSPSWSPEHGQYSEGCSMSQQIVWDLFNNTLEAAEILNIEDEFTNELQNKFDSLDPGLRIGSWGQLQEWKPDWDNPDDTHRHVSHLFCLHPGREISPLTEPEYADAARVSLDARGDGGTGWSKAWKINFRARLHDGNHAHTMLREQLVNSTLPNLWDTHPPFQIDGNFGATSGMAEMLMQSHAGYIHLLPALPDAWPEGGVEGMCARGGFEMGFSWSGGEVTECRVTSKAGAPCEIRGNGITVSFETTEGGIYDVDFDSQSVGTCGRSSLEINTGQSVSIKRNGEKKRISIMFSKKTTKDCTIKLFDLRGREILSRKVPQGRLETRVELSKQAFGAFLMRIEDGEDVLITERVIVVR